MRIVNDRPLYYVLSHMAPGKDEEVKKSIQTRCRRCRRSLWYEADQSPNDRTPRYCMECGAKHPGLGEALRPLVTQTDWETAAARGIEKVKRNDLEYALILGRLLVPLATEFPDDAKVIAGPERMFPDDEEGKCSRCGAACFYRPNTYPDSLPRICTRCYEAGDVDD